MLKKINILIISFFAVLTITFDIGFIIFLPLAIFYILRDSRNIYYITGAGLAAIVLFESSYLYVFLGLMLAVMVFQYLIGKLSKGYYIYLVIVLLNVLSQVALNHQGLMLSFKQYPWHLLILNLISVVLYFYFEHNLLEELRSKSMQVYDNSFLEIVIALTAILGATWLEVYNINVALLVATYFAMYFAYSSKNISALLYALLAMVILIFGFDIIEALFIPFITAIYFLPFVFPMLVINVFLATLIFANTEYQDLTLMALMGISVIFEIIKNFIIKEHPRHEVFLENLSNQLSVRLNHEVLGFALFLDKMVEGVKIPNQQKEQINAAIKLLVQNHCLNCPHKKRCYAQNKANIFYFFRNLIMKKDLSNDSYSAFSAACPKIRELEYTARDLSKRVDLPSINDTLCSQISGISSVIKRYATDIGTRVEINYQLLAELKRRLINYGYEITYFEAQRTYLNDFLIIIGVKGNIDYFDETQNVLKVISENVLERAVSVIFDKNERNTLYVRIVPQIMLDVIYGYGAVSADGNQINGDNFLIKEFDNGRFISVISDGMGKGYNAFYESSTTLKLVETVVSLDLDSITSLEILNTFYAIQDYLERYATLDFLEINRYKLSARFFKMGASTSYLVKANGTVAKIENKNLPFGIEEGVEESEHQLEDNDVIIMTSDGVLESIADEPKVEYVLQQVKDLSPQKIVHELINFSLNNNLTNTDDMTIIALKIKQA